MVSVAAPGGSVGPHTDQYDVFLLQAEGRRRWQIAHEFDHALREGTELNVLESFEAEREWVLEPGDMLYLPPGIAHHGVALDRCMTWSIGMRAPSTADLLQALGEWLADKHGEGRRYADPGLQAPDDAAEIDKASIRRFASLAAGAPGEDDEFTSFLGSFLSRYRLAHEPLGPEPPLDPDTLVSSLGKGAGLRHNPWTRLLWSRTSDGASLFAAGQVFFCAPDTAKTICDRRALSSKGPILAKENARLLCELVNNGHLYLETSP